MSSVYTVQTVVDEVENDEFEISLSDAKKIKKDLKVGDELHGCYS